MLDPTTTIAEIGERALIRHLRERIPSAPGVVVGIGDDTAVLETGPLTLVTTDVLVEGVHFLREWTPPELLGRKALSINLSDIAAMSGVPRYATVSLCLPSDLDLGFVDELYDGLLERAAETGVAIVGGNLSASEGPIVIDVALIGQGDRVLRRSGAVPGDLVVVTGTLGAAAQGLRLLKKGARLEAQGDRLAHAPGMATQQLAPALRCLLAHLDPNPPLSFGRALAEHDYVHAAIDISDGLSGDLMAICEESQVVARIEASAVPVNPDVVELTKSRGTDPIVSALHGGEDYQLLLAVPPGRLVALQDLAVVLSLGLSVVGEFGSGPPALSLRSHGEDQPLVCESHEHFRPRRHSGRGEGAPEI